MDGLLAAGAAAAVVAGLASAAGFAAASVAEAPESVVEGATAVAGAAPEPLKSVAYQPEPLSWNPAAVTCFLNVAFPQVGQSCKGASEIFCNTSLENPQDSHLYAYMGIFKGSNYELQSLKL